MRKPPKNGTITQFSAEYQPPAEAKKQGWLKKRQAAELVKALLSAPFSGNKEMAERVATYLDVPHEAVTVELMLHAQQLKKAIECGDTAAYTAVLDRAYGKASAKIEADMKLSGQIAVLPEGLTADQVIELAGLSQPRTFIEDLEEG